MARVEFSPQVFDDFERFRAHLELYEVDSATIAERIRALIDGIQVLTTSPDMGRTVGGGSRELVVGSGGSGYVVLYRHAPALRLVLILAARSALSPTLSPRGGEGDR